MANWPTIRRIIMGIAEYIQWLLAALSEIVAFIVATLGLS